jgi:hypothetical protein
VQVSKLKLCNKNYKAMVNKTAWINSESANVANGRLHTLVFDQGPACITVLPNIKSIPGKNNVELQVCHKSEGEQ